MKRIRGAEARFQPPPDAAISQLCDHVRCRVAAYRELDDTLGLADMGANTLADVRTGKNGRRRLAGLLRQSAFGRLAGDEDVTTTYTGMGD